MKLIIIFAFVAVSLASIDFEDQSDEDEVSVYHRRKTPLCLRKARACLIKTIYKKNWKIRPRKQRPKLIRKCLREARSCIRDTCRSKGNDDFEDEGSGVTPTDPPSTVNCWKERRQCRKGLPRGSKPLRCSGRFYRCQKKNICRM